MVACITSSKICPWFFYNCGQRGSLLSVARWCPVSLTHNYVSPVPSLLYFCLYLSLGKQRSSTPQPFVVSRLLRRAAMSSASHVLDVSGALSLREVWGDRIYPVIQPMYDVLTLLPSSRMTAKQTEREEGGQEGTQGGRGHHSSQNVPCPGWGA